MFIIWFALWIVLNGRWTTEIAVFGLVFATLMFLFSTFYLGFGPRREARLLLHGLRGIRYGFLLFKEIIKANLNVMRMILTPGFEPKPVLVNFSAGLRELRHRVALADSITLTPGTITCMLNRDHFTVHCLDASLAEGLADGAFVQALHALPTEQPEKIPEPEINDEKEEVSMPEEADCLEAMTSAPEEESPEETREDTVIPPVDPDAENTKEEGAEE